MERLDSKGNLELAKVYQSEVERVYGPDAGAMVDPATASNGLSVITPINGLPEGGWRKAERGVILRYALISMIAGLRQLASHEPA